MQLHDHSFAGPRAFARYMLRENRLTLRPVHELSKTYDSSARNKRAVGSTPTERYTLCGRQLRRPCLVQAHGTSQSREMKRGDLGVWMPTRGPLAAASGLPCFPVVADEVRLAIPHLERQEHEPMRAGTAAVPFAFANRAELRLQVASRGHADAPTLKRTGGAAAECQLGAVAAQVTVGRRRRVRQTRDHLDLPATLAKKDRLQRALVILAEARSWIGTPFHHQGELKGVGVDCGGLVLGVSAAVGLIPANHRGLVPQDLQAYQRQPQGDLGQSFCDLFWTRIAPTALRPGDVVIVRWDGPARHAAIVGDYVHGGLSMIHADDHRSKKVIEHTIRLLSSKAPRAPKIAAAYSLPGVE